MNNGNDKLGLNERFKSYSAWMLISKQHSLIYLNYLIETEQLNATVTDIEYLDGIQNLSISI